MYQVLVLEKHEKHGKFKMLFIYKLKLYLASFLFYFFEFLHLFIKYDA